ncbi:MAG: hypothetical protein A3I68_08400 [Candidatus Melainabacteria bacterium RIFCSPLOWO2_02_FULL_35_15]|nr:MAG: hypothetical protein A3F80_08625 [Candidatus Melainabacteria bacterium RIFCSPLOWO2_12_FULL_35_11]OGI13991.1 MAG: hypothetical protein A3I68_08400 [Candidatus Melainabacteria bacterium RIFCSPLOWO2_02_FULL_35_15]
MSKKIPSIPARDLIKVFEKLGFTFSRQTGSHVQMTKPGKRTIVIQVSNNVPIHHILANIKSAGITKEQFLDLLEQI